MEESQLNIYAMIVDDYGHGENTTLIVAANSGEEALEIVRDKKYNTADSYPYRISADTKGIIYKN